MKRGRAFQKLNAKRHNKGITITTLVIIVIVLLILAGVSISMLSRK